MARSRQVSSLLWYTAKVTLVIYCGLQTYLKKNETAIARSGKPAAVLQPCARLGSRYLCTFVTNVFRKYCSVKFKKFGCRSSQEVYIWLALRAGGRLKSRELRNRTHNWNHLVLYITPRDRHASWKRCGEKSPERLKSRAA